jgi:two-component sensor histidine kinase
MLSRELDHRAKNVLTIVQSVIRLTKADTLEEFKSAIEARVFALARVHSLLAEGGWADAELPTIAARELAAHVDPTRGDTAISISGPSYRLNSTSVQPMAMVLHELAINAVKHGALSTHQGKVDLQWQIDRSARTLSLRWQEHGGPRTRPPEKRGFGSRLIEASVTRQLGGAVSWTWLDTGLVCEITLSDEKVGGIRIEEGG